MCIKIDLYLYPMDNLWLILDFVKEIFNFNQTNNAYDKQKFCSKYLLSDMSKLNTC